MNRNRGTPSEAVEQVQDRSVDSIAKRLRSGRSRIVWKQVEIEAIHRERKGLQPGTQGWCPPIDWLKFQILWRYP